MTEHDQQSSGVEAAANVQPSQGRRRWVKGAMLAMPAVLTLRSGRLAARASGTGCPVPVLSTPGAVGDNSGYVDSQGTTLIWVQDTNSNVVLGYTNGDVFDPVQPFTTSSCWASTPIIN